MTKDNSESFEEWYIDRYNPKPHHNPLHRETSEYWSKLAWNHQQKKIDELRISNARLFSDNGDISKSFKNFHKNLCKRFNYFHDEKNWNRDLASLDEYVAEKLQAAEEELSNACELIKSLRELAIDLWENDASETDWLDVERFHELIEKAEALEKVCRSQTQNETEEE